MSSIHLIKYFIKFKIQNLKNDKFFTEMQNQRFRKLLRYVYKKSTFYREYYQTIGIKFSDLEIIPVTELPSINKNIMMENFDKLVTDPILNKKAINHFIYNNNNLDKKFADKYTVIHTSGSSGTIGFFIYGPKEWAFPVFEPFLCRLIPSDIKFPCNLRYTSEILFFVNADLACFIMNFFYNIVAIYRVCGDIVLDNWIFQQVDGPEL